MATENDIIDQFGRRYAAGERIFRAGDFGEEMFIIHSGRVGITINTDEGEKTLVVLGAGDFFGEMAVIDKGPRSANATALDETVCIVLNEELFEQQMQRNAKIVKKILKNMSTRIRAMDEQLQMLTSKDYNMRVVNALLLHINKNGENTMLQLSLLVQQTGMEENKTKLESILETMAKARVISISGENITVSSTLNVEKYKQYLEMKKAFGES